ncbi:MAG: hypothetical protein M3071_07020 [Actinomycetota bacterium]|nr:hypothetical protein [Actinomycetota bacterium]
MTARQLNVAAQVAELLPAAHLAQLQAEVDDPDKRCPRCGQLVTGATVEAVVLRDGDFHLARLAHPECARSGLYEYPGLRVTQAEQLANGLDVNYTLGRRARPRPRALVFIELLTHLSAVPPGADLASAPDPLDDYATGLGLQPVTGTIDQITPAKTTTSTLHLEVDGLTLTHANGHDTIPADPHALAAWRQASAADEATALVITGRGLGLARESPTIAEALATRPAWAATVNVTGLPRPRSWTRLTRRQ